MVTAALPRSAHPGPIARLRTALANRQSRARARYTARRAHALWVSDRLAEVDVSQLDRLDRWLAS